MKNKTLLICLFILFFFYPVIVMAGGCSTEKSPPASSSSLSPSPPSSLSPSPSKTYSADVNKAAHFEGGERIVFKVRLTDADVICQSKEGRSEKYPEFEGAIAYAFSERGDYSFWHGPVGNDNVIEVSFKNPNPHQRDPQWIYVHRIYFRISLNSITCQDNNKTVWAWGGISPEHPDYVAHFRDGHIDYSVPEDRDWQGISFIEVYEGGEQKLIRVPNGFPADKRGTKLGPQRASLLSMARKAGARKKDP